MAETFWNISKDSKIEIPEIQRDYAQGRINERVDTIRKDFVSDLLDTLISGKSLNLDFVFGQSVDRTNQANFNKSKQSLEQMLEVLKQYSKDTGVAFESKVAPKPMTNSSDKLLIPFDGQQRLTTLFLLHLYIGTMAKKEISILANFNYKTRESSTQFIENIITHNEVILHFKPLEHEDIKVLSASIKNQSWFFSSWEKDPTVAGMLVMLDEIRKQSIKKKLDFENAWANLVENDCIIFDYFDIQEEGFDEDLYVKMNARGKGLTDFENFRAWLEKKHKSTLPHYNWVQKIDKDWLDLFWKSKKTVKDVDVNFMAFFKNMGLLQKLNTSFTTSDNNFSVEKEVIELLKPKRYTPNTKYDEENIFNESSLDYIFSILDIIVSDIQGNLNRVINEFWTETFRGKTETDFTVALLTDFDSLNLYHKTFFFSILKFLEIRAENDINKYTVEDWDKFRDWIRVSRNLIYNSRLDDNTAYIPAIRAINTIDKVIITDTNVALNSITIEDDKEKWISFFNKAQQKEECNKMLFILHHVDALKWSDLINRAENHFYFYGQIDFIFKLAQNDIIKFEEYLNKLSLLFSESNINSGNYVLQCLFFAFDDSDTWLKSESQNRFKFYGSAIGTSRDRNENWRIIFDDDTKRVILKDLLDSNTCELDDIQAVITSKLEGLVYDDWKYFILDEPTMLKHCGSALFTKASDDNIRLLEKTQNSSRQRELRSFHLYKKLKTTDDLVYPPFKWFWYFTGERGNLNPCIALTEWIYNETNYFIDCFFDSGAFTIRLGSRTNGEICKNIVSTFTDEYPFVLNDNVLWFYNISHNEIENKLQMILSTLNKF